MVQLLSVGRALTARGAMTHDVWIRVILPFAVELPPRMRVVNPVHSSAFHFSIIAADADSAAHPLRYGVTAIDDAYYELDWPPSVAGGGGHRL